MGNRLTLRQVCKVYLHYENHTATGLSEILNVPLEWIKEALDEYGYRTDEEIPLSTIIPKLVKNYKYNPSTLKTISEEFLISEQEAKRHSHHREQRKMTGYYTILSDFINWYTEKQG